MLATDLNISIVLTEKINWWSNDMWSEDILKKNKLVIFFLYLQFNWNKFSLMILEWTIVLKWNIFHSNNFLYFPLIILVIKQRYLNSIFKQSHDPKVFSTVFLSMPIISMKNKLKILIAEECSVQCFAHYSFCIQN